MNYAFCEYSAQGSFGCNGDGQVQSVKSEAQSIQTRPFDFAQACPMVAPKSPMVAPKSPMVAPACPMVAPAQTCPMMTKPPAADKNNFTMCGSTTQDASAPWDVDGYVPTDSPWMAWNH